MEVRAVAKFVRVQPRKVRIVAANLRGKPAVQAVTLLRFHPSKSARTLNKVLLSAIANAQENLKLSQENLRIREIRIDEGPVLKRIQARAMGRANRILKRMSHITVVVEDFEPAPPVKKHGTSAKPRPKFDAPKRSGKKSAAPAQESAAPDVDAQAAAVDASGSDATAEEATAPEATGDAASDVGAEPEAAAAEAEAPPAEAEPEATTDADSQEKEGEGA